MDGKKWWQQKTTWSGIAAIVVAIGAYFQGLADPVMTGQAVLAGFMVIFVRTGLESAPKAWWQQKTTWTGILSVGGALLGFVTGTLPIAAAIQTAVLGITGIFMRQAVNDK